MNERLSAFLDNETTPDECDAVVSELLRDEKLRVSWSRQHQIRDALRASHGEASVGVDVGFTARVMHAIEHESAAGRQGSPAIPDAAAFAVESTRDNVIAMPRRRRRRWRNVAGLAVAASAAGFALFVTQPLQRFTTTEIVATPVARTSGSQPATVAAAAAPRDTSGLSFETVAAANTGGFGDFDMPWNLGDSLAQRLASGVDQAQAAVDRWSVSNPTLANRLNQLLFEHNGLARGYGVGATTPAFVRVATYGQDFSQ